MNQIIMSLIKTKLLDILQRQEIWGNYEGKIQKDKERPMQSEIMKPFMTMQSEIETHRDIAECRQWSLSHYIQLGCTVILVVHIHLDRLNIIFTFQRLSIYPWGSTEAKGGAERKRPVMNNNIGPLLQHHEINYNSIIWILLEIIGADICENRLFMCSMAPYFTELAVRLE